MADAAIGERARRPGTPGKIRTRRDGKDARLAPADTLARCVAKTSRSARRGVTRAMVSARGLVRKSATRSDDPDSEKVFLEAGDSTLSPVLVFSAPRFPVYSLL
jgi:hypothetical protein